MAGPLSINLGTDQVLPLLVIAALVQQVLALPLVVCLLWLYLLGPIAELAQYIILTVTDSDLAVWVWGYGWNWWNSLWRLGIGYLPLGRTSTCLPGGTVSGGSAWVHLSLGRSCWQTDTLNIMAGLMGIGTILPSDA